jgi:hypothetical protein
LARGTVDSLAKIPGAAWDTAKAAVDGWRILIGLGMGGSGRLKTPLSDLARSTQSGQITLQKAFVGALDASPIGVLAHAARGDYYGAGSALTGTVVGLGSGPASSYVIGQANKLPILGESLALGDVGVGAFGQRGAVAFGNTALSPASEVKLGLQTLDPTTVSFTQSSVSYAKAGASYNLDTLVQSMSKEGWVGKPIDIVAMPDGTLASIDNTRVLAARQAGINVEANVRAFDEAITDEKGNVPDTWGDAALLRINKPIQNLTYPGMNPGWSVRFPYGSIYDPVVKY